MAHDPAKRVGARNAYVHQRLTLDVVALRVGVKESTVRRWKKDALENGDDWDKSRIAASVSREGVQQVLSQLIDDYIIMHHETLTVIKEAVDLSPMDRVEALKGLADAFAKTMASAGKANPALSRIAVANDIIQRFGDFVSREFPQHGRIVLEILEPFAAELASEYG